MFLKLKGEFGVEFSNPILRNKVPGTYLVAQWLRICLPMQGTWV